MSNQCDTIQELIPDYAFGLTEQDETRLVELYLADCTDAAQQLGEFQSLQAALRADVPQIEPPAHLADRLMDAVAEPAAPAKSRRLVLRPVWLIAAAAVIALVVTNVYWLLRVNDLTRRQDELVASTSAPQNTAFVLTGTSALRWVRLPSSEQNVNANAFLMWNAESEIGLLYASGFPELSVGKTYQLWFTRGEERISGGTFRVDNDGKGALLFHITQPIDKYTWARITAEPASGSDAPTGNVVVNGKLTT